MRKSNKGAFFWNEFEFADMNLTLPLDPKPERSRCSCSGNLAAWNTLMDLRDLLREAGDREWRERMRAASEHSGFLTS